MMTYTHHVLPHQNDLIDHIIRYGIFSSLDLELLIELNLHEDHLLRWTRMTKYYYYFDILDLIVAFGHDELWLRPWLKSDWPNRLSKATTYWRWGVLKFETFLYGYFSKWVPKNVGNAFIFFFIDFDHFFFKDTYSHHLFNFCLRNFWYLSPEDVGTASKLKGVRNRG